MTRIEGIKLEVPGDKLKELVLDNARHLRGLADEALIREEKQKKAAELGAGPPALYSRLPPAYDRPTSKIYARQAETFETMSRFIEDQAIYLLEPDDFHRIFALSPDTLGSMINGC